jgi:trigger factor
MKTSLNTLEGLKRSVVVELPIADFNKKVDKTLAEMSKNATIDGFRKGKVPAVILKKRFGASANNDAIHALVGDTLNAALLEAKVEPAHQPQLANVDLKSNKDIFSYTVEFEVFPEIKLADFSQLTFEAITANITTEDEAKTLEGLKSQSTTYQIVERKSQTNDQLSIDFKGFIDGEAFEGGESKDFKLVLGKGTMIEGFETGLTGVVAGLETKLDLVFPKEYHAKDLAGKKVVFDVTVNRVEAPETPEENDEFAIKFGEKDMASLKSGIKKQMQTELDNRLQKTNQDAMFKALLEANEFEVPSATVEQEAQNFFKDMDARLSEQGMESVCGIVVTDMFFEEA